MSPYEEARAEAQAVYDRMLAETHRITIQARAPVRPSWLREFEMPSFWRKVANVLRREKLKKTGR